MATSTSDDQILMYLASLANMIGVDVGDKDSVVGFLDQLKGLVTRDKSELISALRKYRSKGAKQLATKAQKLTSGKGSSLSSAIREMKRARV